MRFVSIKYFYYEILIQQTSKNTNIFGAQDVHECRIRIWSKEIPPCHDDEMTARLQDPAFAFEYVNVALADGDCASASLIPTPPASKTHPGFPPAPMCRIVNGENSVARVVAVARACAANRIAVAVPCHRVVRGSGDLAGYKWGVARKKALLAREGADAAKTAGQ
jgi:O-6-methylguanine DNA methyltransferase